MSLPLLAAVVIAVLVLGYRFYGRLIARQFALADTTDTPAHRLADGMDASHEQTVRWVEAIVAGEGKLLIRMQSRTKAKAEVHATRERAHLIERVYGLDVEVIAERQGPPPATANLAPLSVAGGSGDQ